jgi:hypothetical protein
LGVTKIKLTVFFTVQFSLPLARVPFSLSNTVQGKTRQENSILGKNVIQASYFALFEMKVYDPVVQLNMV